MKKYICGPKTNARLRPITIFNPYSNTRNSAIMDDSTMMVIGFNKDGPAYFECGAKEAIEGGIVEGSTLYGFDVIHCHGDTYRLETQMELRV